MGRGQLHDEADTFVSRALQAIREFNIDPLLNPIVPPNCLDLLPRPIAHFLGHRSHPPRDASPLLRQVVIFTTTLAGLCLVGGIFSTAPGILQWQPPALIASLGATAILDYNIIASPLAQPRNAILGHTLAAVVGVAISKLFQLNPDFDNIRWVSGAVGCACSSVVMNFSNSLHPPGGATAVLASVDEQILKLGWHFPVLILLASSLMTAVACIFNNTLRRYPVNWWTPDEAGSALPFTTAARRRERQASSSVGDVEEGVQREPSELKPIDSSPDLSTKEPDDLQPLSLLDQIPASVDLNQEERLVLEQLDLRIRGHHQLPTPLI